MIEIVTSLAWPFAMLATAVIASAAALWAWRGWLDLKRLEITATRSGDGPTNAQSGVKIELAAVRERLRRLEEIAAGVDP